jgi:hypothetical protein
MLGRTGYKPKEFGWLTNKYNLVDAYNGIPFNPTIFGQHDVPERVCCATVSLGDSITAAHTRHSACFPVLFQLFGGKDKYAAEANRLTTMGITDEQGFLTTKGRILTRSGAAELCYKNGQAPVEWPTIYSENLW